MSDIKFICEQRKQFQLYNIPPIRLEVISPYVEDNLGRKFTQQQLDMRRKTEILKYNKNSTQGPQLTKKQRLAASLRGNYNVSRVVCPNDYKIPVLTTSSGIPGPAIFLVEDRDVILYNYSKNTDAYAENTYDDDEQFFFTSNTNQLVRNINQFIPIAKLIIRKPIRQPFTQFTYSTPILFRMKATGLPATSTDITITNAIQPTALSFQATYNNVAVSNHIQLTARFISTSSISAKLKSPTTTGTYNFFCEQYVGLLQISGIQLTTTSGFVYDFNINYILSVDTGQDNTVDSLIVREKTTFELYANIDSSYVVVPPINCDLIIAPTLELPNIADAQVTFTGTPA